MIWLRRWLGLEHEAVWTYELIAARHEALREEALASAQRHRDTIAELEQIIDPIAAQRGYDIGTLSSQQEARDLIVDIENRIMAACLGSLTATQGRTLALTVARDCARATVRAGAKPSAFPGLADGLQ